MTVPAERCDTSGSLATSRDAFLHFIGQVVARATIHGDESGCHGSVTDTHKVQPMVDHSDDAARIHGLGRLFPARQRGLDVDSDISQRPRGPWLRNAARRARVPEHTRGRARNLVACARATCRSIPRIASWSTRVDACARRSRVGTTWSIFKRRFSRMAWACALRAGCGVKPSRAITRISSNTLHHYLPLVPSGLPGRVARRVSRAQCNAVDAVLSPSPQMAEALRAYGVATPIEVIPTGLEIESLSGGNGRRFRLEHGIGMDRPVMLTVGRVAFEKNLEFLLDVVDAVRARIPDVLLVIAGEGPALPALERRVAQMGLSKSVRFVGYLDRTGEFARLLRERRRVRLRLAHGNARTRAARGHGGGSACRLDRSHGHESRARGCSRRDRRRGGPGIVRHRCRTCAQRRRTAAHLVLASLPIRGGALVEPRHGRAAARVLSAHTTRRLGPPSNACENCFGNRGERLQNRP